MAVRLLRVHQRVVAVRSPKGGIMLADELIETYTNNKYETARIFKVINKKGCEELVADLKAAKKFVLTEDVYALARESLWQKPIAFLAVSDYAKPPFPLTWIEYEASFKKHDGALDSIRGTDEAPLTKRVGFLCKVIDEETVLISMGYSYKDKNKESTFNLLSFIYSNKKEELRKIKVWVDENAETYLGNEALEGARSEKQELIEEIINSHPDYNAKEMEAAKLLSEKWMPFPCPYFAEAAMKIAQQEGAQATLERQIGCHADWVGEGGVPEAVFVFLACKNALEQVPCHDLQQLNKARRLRGKQPLHEFTTLNISLSHAQKLSYATCNSDDERAKMRLHWVRGHFKRRATGIFWWNPHLAGNAELGMVEKNYSISK